MNLSDRQLLVVAVLFVSFELRDVHAIPIDTVPVGNPGNAADSTGFGSVPYEYRIGTYEVTNSQYAEFLNAVAKTDTYGVYSGYGIAQSGFPGGYSYSADATWANRPVVGVSFWHACRFANWLHNGQPTGPQNAATTEDGAYTLTADGIANNSVTRNAGWQWAVTSENEWYKAAYHKNDGATGNYYLFPTSTDDAPSHDLINPDPGNNANFWQNGGYTYADGPFGGVYVTDVGEFENSESPYGTFDQGGNAEEWNESIFSGSARGLRGLSFHYGYSGFPYESYGLSANVRYSGLSSTIYGTIGFRVVTIVPEPTSFGMASTALCGILIARWRATRRRIFKPRPVTNLPCGRLALLLAATFALAGEFTHAAEIKWVGNQSDQTELRGAASFHDGNYWFNYVPPGENDTAILGSGFDPQMNGTLPHYLYFGAYQTSYLPKSPGGADPLIPAGNAVVKHLEVRAGGNWTFDFGSNVIGGPHDAETGSLTVRELMYVGLPRETGSLSPHPAVLTVRNGKLTQSEAGAFSSLTLGNGLNSDGKLIVTGADAEVELARGAWIGNAGGVGRLEVIHGGRFSAVGISTGAYDGPSGEPSTGHVKIIGNESYIYGLNGLNHGTILISEGATAEAATDAFVFLGISDGRSAEATVTGPNSKWQIAQRLTIGGVYHTDTSGRGALNITDGGNVSSEVVSLANRSRSQGDVLISGEGSEWHANFMMLGDDGHGTALVTDQGRIVTGLGGAVIGNTENGIGEVMVQESAVWNLSGPLTVAGGGQGKLTVESGGVTSVAARLAIGNAGIVDVHNEGILNIGAGELPIAGVVRIGSGGTLSGKGTIVGDLLIDGGTVTPGFSPGVLQINGNFHQLTAGLLTMELGGTAPGVEYDQLLVSGDLLLEGTVQIAFIDGFVPKVGNQFDLFTASTAQLAGQFTFLNAPPNLQYSTSLNGGVVTLTVVPEPASLVLLTFAVIALALIRSRWMYRPGRALQITASVIALVLFTVAARADIFQ